ncbi:cellulase family glycosylhydrolase [Mesorhizobium sp. M0578]|uniref:glycoside hydrolase 5 family protein n=1 Tax=unclassified Mesorhizobium TaxID=325217 RepID=UPI00333C1E55
MIVGWQRVRNRLRNAGLRVLVCALLSVPAVVSAADDPSATSFIKTSGTNFTLDGKPFFVTGVNNHYLTYGSPDEVTRVLDDAVAMGANVVRTFLQPVIGSLDGSKPTIWDWRLEGEASNLSVKGTYLLYWDPSQNRMAINDGADGMQKVDFLIAEAGKRRLRLIIAVLDFWAFTGGAQQMRAWYGSRDAPGVQSQYDTDLSKEKSEFFFQDPRTKRDYRTWVSHVVQRVNPLTGLAYRDDPTIMAWELMNEGNAQPEALRLAWTTEMTAYVKSLDPNHLVTSGHANVESKLSDLTIPTLDFGTWHGYPLYYKLTVQQFDSLITEFCRLAVRAGKPVLLEEFGYARSNQNFAQAYAMWLDTLTRERNCAGWMVWRLVSRQDSGRYPVDEYDKFDIHNDGGPLWNILKAATARATQTRETSPASETSRQLP